jgi:catechol 2,3-dioxygenase-like lactoylglutathione lyase family enzyme
VVNVSDVEASARWYARVLGMARQDFLPEEGKPPRTAMIFGQQKINLRPVVISKEDWFTADHEAAGSDDLCFLTDSTPDEVVRHLQAEGVEIAAGPGPRSGARGTLTSVYCRDPDGSLIEIGSYA